MHHKLNTKKLKPFTQEELVSIHKYLGALHRKYGENIPFSAIALPVETDDFKLPVYIATETIRGKSKYVNQSLTKDVLIAQNQDGVGYKNLLSVLEHWNSIVLPEAVKLRGNGYWIIEGHHRVTLQILARRKQIMFFVEKPQYKDKNMSIRSLQRSFAREIARSSDKEIKDQIDKLFGDKNVTALEKLIEKYKNKWPKEVVRYASNMLEDLVYAMDHYRKYEMAGYTTDEIKKLVHSKEILKTQHRKSTDPVAQKELANKIAVIDSHLAKAKAEDQLHKK